MGPGTAEIGETADRPLDQLFQPSRATKLWWRYTRKEPANFAGVTLPGLFQTIHFERDTVLFIILVILEVVGVWSFLVVGGIRPVAVLFLFIIDIVLAVSRHGTAGKKCELKSKMVYEDDEIIKARHRRGITRLRLLTNIMAIGIIAVAGFKMLSFYAVQGKLDAFTLFIMLTYAVVAALHLWVTGYFIAELIRALSFWHDKQKFLNATGSSSLGISAPVASEFETDVTLKEVRVGGHSLSLKAGTGTASEGKGGAHTYILATWGLLTDAELHSLITAQTRMDARAVVAREGLRHQVTMILEREVAA